MTISDVTAAYGQYYINNGQNAQRLRKLLYHASSKLDALCTTMPTMDTQLRFARSTMTSVLQGFQKDWTPKGDMDFKPSPINLHPIKVDIEVYPHELEESWLGFLATEDKSPKDWPFIRWAIEEHYLGKLQEEWILEAAYGGVFAAPTVGTASAPGTVVNGLRKIINDSVAAGDITTIATGALDTADPEALVGQIEDFAKAISTRYRGHNMTIAANMDVYDAYREGVDIKYNKHYDQADRTRIHRFGNLHIEGMVEMGTSGKIFCTPQANLIKGVRGVQNQNTFEIEAEDRKVKLFTDYHIGYGLIVPGAVFTNDQDLV